MVCPYLAPFLRYSEILVENRQSEVLNLPHLYFVPPLGSPRWNIVEIFSIRKLESLGYCMLLFAQS